MKLESADDISIFMDMVYAAFFIAYFLVVREREKDKGRFEGYH